ncbi:hypothetical protein GCM10010412_097990 [Nonomuraea recticatena]|uniref:Uncharacterized protein n=1 Tax=Nonomuraea recticatena TaxID=46178 RepID=A0ABP6FTV6_9ACTN
MNMGWLGFGSSANRARPPLVESAGWGGWTATWPRDSLAGVMMEKEGRGVNVSYLARGKNPRGSGGQMLADTLRAAGIHRPTAIRISEITNRETQEALIRGFSPGETKLGKTLRRTAAELGGRITNWSSGDDGLPWIKAQIKY